MATTFRSFAILSLLLGISAILPDRAAAAPPTDACALLTPAQIGTALGVTMAAGVPVTPTVRTSCKWLESGVDSMKAKTVIISIKSVQAYEMGKLATGGRLQMTPVSGIGDEAYMTSGTISYGATLSVKKSGAAFTVTVRGYPDVPTIQDKDKALARQITF